MISRLDHPPGDLMQSGDVDAWRGRLVEAKQMKQLSKTTISSAVSDDH